MSVTDWYRNTEWNEEIAARFEAKLARARKKSQYLRIQAHSLVQSEPLVALRLLDRYFNIADNFDQAWAYDAQAAAYRSLGQLEKAAESYEQALLRESEFPNLRSRACFELPFLIATAPLPDRFDRALAILGQTAERLSFPVDAFLWNTAYALILSIPTRTREAAAHAQAALEASRVTNSGLQYHPQVGLVGDRFPKLLEQLAEIAHAA